MPGGLVAAMLASLAAGGVAAAGPAPASHYEVRVDGLACPFCAYGLEKKLEALPGVGQVEVDLGSGLAAFDVAAGAALEPGDLKKAVRDAGFTPREITARLAGTARRSGNEVVLELDGVTLPVHTGAVTDRLDELVRGERRAVIVTGQLVKDAGAWHLRVAKVRAAAPE